MSEYRISANKTEELKKEVILSWISLPDDQHYMGSFRRYNKKEISKIGKKEISKIGTLDEKHKKDVDEFP